MSVGSSIPLDPDLNIWRVDGGLRDATTKEAEASLRKPEKGGR